MTIKVINIIKSPIAAFHNEGLEIFGQLDKAYNSHQTVKLSFAGIERCATQFLNASIGRMYLMYDPNKIDQFITYEFEGIKNLDKKIEEVRANAIHAKEYDSLIENATA